MKLKDLYKIAIETGIAQDPRGIPAVKKELKERNETFKKLSKPEQEEFDLESLSNPYADTRVIFGDENKEIKRALVGIDIETAEILLAERLSQKENKPIDLCISHHPEGVAWAGFYEVMGIQANILADTGIPIHIGESLIHERMQEVARKVHAANHNRSLDAAKLLNIPLMSIHTAADNCAHSFVSKLLKKKNPERLEDIIEALKEVPEYKMAGKSKAGPTIIKGTPKQKAGKILVEMTGGTEGHSKIYENYVHAGISTIVCMHLSEGGFKEAQKNYLNIILAGHISSDNIGLNHILDAVQKKEKIDIIACSGFRRVTRNT